MSACVVDASALIHAVADKTREAAALRARLTRTRVHAPHLIDAEVGNALRRYERQRLLDANEATLALRAGRALVDERCPQAGPIGDAAWAMRHNLSFYDALYVALAAALELPLLTADARLRSAPALPCQLELV